MQGHYSAEFTLDTYCQGRNVIDSKRRAEFDPIADITNAGIITAGYGSAGISAGGAV